jgi:hypothetical protein
MIVDMLIPNNTNDAMSQCDDIIDELLSSFSGIPEALLLKVSILRNM